MNKQDIQTVLNALQNSQLFVQASSNINVLEGFGQQLDDADEAIAILTAALAEPSEAEHEAVAWSEWAIDEYLEEYSLIGDDGDYTPSDDEKFVIKDAIIGFMSATPETKTSISLEDIQQAVARGWCSDRNLLKRMDSDLATDIAYQVAALLFTHPAPNKPLESDKDFCQAIAERDEYHDMADKLAEGIALHFDGDIGEHSSSNSPWDRALDLLDSAACAETMRLTRPASKPSEPVGFYAPKCFASNPSPQEQAENDCATCSHQHDCLAHPASKPSPLTADEVWKSDAIMAVNASMDVKMNDLMKLVRAIEQAVWEKMK
jgi:hypothetical protein